MLAFFDGFGLRHFGVVLLDNIDAPLVQGPIERSSFLGQFRVGNDLFQVGQRVFGAEDSVEAGETGGTLPDDSPRTTLRLYARSIRR